MCIYIYICIYRERESIYRLYNAFSLICHIRDGAWEKCYLFLHLVADLFCCQLWKDDVGHTSILRRRSSSIRCFSASISCSSFRRPCEKNKKMERAQKVKWNLLETCYLCKTRSIESNTFKWIQIQSLRHAHGKCMHHVRQAWASVSARRRSACNASSSRRLASHRCPARGSELDLEI